MKHPEPSGRIALGTVQFGFDYGIANTNGQVTGDMAKSMLRLATASSINTIDTAIDYGQSESCLGDAGMSNFNVVTKLPAVPDGCDDIATWVESELDASLARLQTKSAYALLLHQSAQLLGDHGKLIYDSLQKLKAQGKLKKIGISIYSPDELAPVTKTYDLDLVQAPFNLIDQRLHTSGWLQRLKRSGVEVHTRSAFLQGLLVMPQNQIPAKFARWSDIWENWHCWLAQNQVSAVQACLAFPLAYDEIDRVVIGADNAAQLEQVIAAANNAVQVDLPDLKCSQEELINPSHWPDL